MTLEALRPRLRCNSMILNEMDLKRHFNSSIMCFYLSHQSIQLCFVTGTFILNYFNDVHLVQLSVSDSILCWPCSPGRTQLFSVLLIYRPLPQPDCSDFCGLQKKPAVSLSSGGYITFFVISSKRPYSRSIS